MIIDINAWTGHWSTLPVDGNVASVRASLKAIGVDRICLSPLDAAWCPNPHRCNAEVYAAARQFTDIDPVPVLDPTIATWRDEVAYAITQPRVRLVKLLPAYSPYDLSAADDLFEALAQYRLAVIIQTRLDDPRHQHPLAQVPDCPAAAIADVAERYPKLTVIIGGPGWTAIRALCERLLTLPNLYADISQADGMDTLSMFVAEGLTPKLLFGSHAPLFVPFSALARVINDLSDDDATAILGGNAERILETIPNRGLNSAT